MDHAHAHKNLHQQPYQALEHSAAGMAGAMHAHAFAISRPRANLAHGRLPSKWFASTQSPYGTSMPQSARRPQHHSRRFDRVQLTSGLTPQADIIADRRHVSKVLITDTSGGLISHVVGNGK